MGRVGDPKTHRKREAVLELIRQGLSNTEVGRRLKIERQMVGLIRKDAGIADAPRQPLSLEEKWSACTRPVAGGHLEWTGERQSTVGTPVLRYKEKPYTAAQVAFRIRHGREPQGYVFAECGFKHCVAPDHVDDKAERTKTREQLRYLAGGSARPQQCAHGHGQSQWGRYETDGRAYCHACKLARKEALRRSGGEREAG